MRHRSKVENTLHIAWATYRRYPFLTPDIEKRVHHCIAGELARLECPLLAIGGVEDHVHLVVMLPSRLSLARLMQQIKGVSSHMAGQIVGPTQGFQWQEGFGAFGLSRPHVETACIYVRRQKQRHASGMIWPDWEPDAE